MILVTGSEGQVGYALLRALAHLGEVKGLTRADGDLSNPETVTSVLDRYQPGCIVNAAACTAVDQAESDPAPAPRPLNSRLDVSRIEQSLGLAMPDWRQALQLTVRNAKASTLADLSQAGDLFD